MPESIRSKILRWRFNFFPAYRGTGGRVTFIADDLREVRIRLPLSWRTKNYVGTIYGGSIYGAVDPFFMIMLMRHLGREYIVWDKAATVKFRKAGRSTLYATFRMEPDEVEAVRQAAASGEPIDRYYTVDLVDAHGVVHASVEKVIYVRKK